MGNGERGRLGLTAKEGEGEGQRPRYACVGAGGEQ